MSTIQLLRDAKELRMKQEAEFRTVLHARINETVFLNKPGCLKIKGKVISRDKKTICVEFVDFTHGFISIPQA